VGEKDVRSDGDQDMEGGFALFVPSPDRLKRDLRTLIEQRNGRTRSFKKVVLFSRRLPKTV